jgi:hypothetical protein
MTEQEVVTAQRIIDEKANVEVMLKALTDAQHGGWHGGHQLRGLVTKPGVTPTLEIGADLRPYIIKAVTDYRDRLKVALADLGVA